MTYLYIHTFIHTYLLKATGSCITCYLFVLLKICNTKLNSIMKSRFLSILTLAGRPKLRHKNDCQLVAHFAGHLGIHGVIKLNQVWHKRGSLKTFGQVRIVRIQLAVASVANPRMSDTPPTSLFILHIIWDEIPIYLGNFLRLAAEQTAVWKFNSVMDSSHIWIFKITCTTLIEFHPEGPPRWRHCQSLWLMERPSRFGLPRVVADRCLPAPDWWPVVRFALQDQ